MVVFVGVLYDAYDVFSADGVSGDGLPVWCPHPEVGSLDVFEESVESYDVADDTVMPHRLMQKGDVSLCPLLVYLLDVV